VEAVGGGMETAHELGPEILQPAIVRWWWCRRHFIWMDEVAREKGGCVREKMR
jgi:hypothetical protein